MRFPRETLLFAIVLPFCISGSSCTSVNVPADADSSSTSMTIATSTDLRPYFVESTNPFIEYRSLLHKPDYRFIIFKIENSKENSIVDFETLKLDSQGCEVPYISYYRDTLTQYWTGFSIDDVSDRKMRKIIEKYVPPASGRLFTKKRGILFIVVSVKEANTPIDVWNATLKIDGALVEMSGSCP